MAIWLNPQNLYLIMLEEGYVHGVSLFPTTVTNKETITKMKRSIWQGILFNSSSRLINHNSLMAPSTYVKNI